MNEYVVTINGKKKLVRISGQGTVALDGTEVNASITKVNPHFYILRYGEKIYEVAVNKFNNELTRFLIDGWYFDSTVRTKLRETAFELQKNKEKFEHKSDVKAPMPGLILKFKKKTGDTVELGESLLILEAMKMENDLRSPASGTIKSIHYKEGQTVEKDSIIISIE